MKESNMYTEVYEILKILGPSYINKLPKDLYKYIENNRNKNYLTNIDVSLSIEEQNLMKETIEFISFINLKYWADEEERKKLISIYNENEIKYNQQYNSENIFKNNKK